MSLATFPVFRCVPADSIERDPSDGNVAVQRSRNFNKLTSDFGGDETRFSFVIQAIAEEAATFRAFYAARRGAWDPFTWTDPGTGLSWKVQFDGPYAEKDIAPSITAFRVSLVTVP